MELAGCCILHPNKTIHTQQNVCKLNLCRWNKSKSVTSVDFEVHTYEPPPDVARRPLMDEWISHLLSFSFPLYYFPTGSRHVKMSSLVAYEDSESEDDHLDQTEEETSASVQTAPREHNQEVRMCKSSEITPRPHNLTSDADGSVVENIFERRSFLLPPHSQPQSRLDSESNYSRDGPAQGNNFRDAAAPLSLPMSQGKSSPRQTLPHMPQRFGDGLNPAKRNPTVRSGVRPYIPKRQRLAPSVGTADPTYPAEQDPGSLTRDSHMISDVSARIKPYLSHKPGAAGIPRRLLMSLGGHQGPVNTVRWCPVPHLSHLLLSASMDKTFKVMSHSRTPPDTRRLSLGT